MSQQPQWPTQAGDNYQQQQQQQQQPIKYGDVFPVSGEIASKTISPQDAALMQSAESFVLGQPQQVGPAAVMQWAATQNERAGVVGQGQVTGIAGDQGITVAETYVPGGRVVSESVRGQVIGQYVQPAVQGAAAGGGGGIGGGGDIGRDEGKITIGDALESIALSAYSAGIKPVDQSDAAAILAAEMMATGHNVATPGGVAAAAQAAATANALTTRDEDKTKLGDVLTGAKSKMPADKAVTRSDAEGILGAEMRNNPDLVTHPGGVAASVVAAARLNQNTG